jgi:hypothetical protein
MPSLPRRKPPSAATIPHREGGKSPMREEDWDYPELFPPLFIPASESPSPAPEEGEARA